MCANMTSMVHESTRWFSALAAPVALALWPFKRRTPTEPDQQEATPPDDAAGEATIDHMDWGIRLGMLGRFERAAERFEQAADADPQDPSAHYNQALSLDQAGNHERARDIYNRAIEIDPGFADSHTNLALALLALGNSQAAVESLEKARELNSGDPVVHFDLGCIHLSGKQWQEAVSEFSEAVKCDPKDAQTRFNLSIALERAGSHEDAEREMRDFLALARARYPEQRAFAAKFLGEQYGEKGE